MRKKYLSRKEEKERCPVCNKLSRHFTEWEGQFICESCFIALANKKFKKEKPLVYALAQTKGKAKLFDKSYKGNNPPKSIYAINGIEKLYRGGCSN